MSILSEYELLQNLSTSFVTNKDPNTQYHNFTGWCPAMNVSSRLTTTLRTLGTEEHLSITLPSSNQQLQISSTSEFDNSLQIEIIGWDQNFNPLSETISLHSSTPHIIAMQLSNSYFRIKSMNVPYNSSPPVGAIFLSKYGSSIGGGFPLSIGDYIYSMLDQERQSSLLNGCIPPSTNGQLLPNYISYSVSNEADTPATFRFQMKKTNTANWGTEFKFFVENKSNTQFRWRLDGVENIPNNNPSYGYDVRVQGMRGDSNGATNPASITAMLSIKQVEI